MQQRKIYIWIPTCTSLPFPANLYPFNLYISSFIFYTPCISHFASMSTKCIPPKCIPPKCTWKVSHSISIKTPFPMNVDGKKLIYARMSSRRPEKSVKFWTFTTTSNQIWIYPYWVCRIGGCDFKYANYYTWICTVFLCQF